MGCSFLACTLSPIYVITGQTQRYTYGSVNSNLRVHHVLEVEFNVENINLASVLLHLQRV